TVAMPAQRNGGAGNNHRSADIATHGVKRDSNLLRHERPGKPDLLRSEALGRGLESCHRWRRSAKRNAVPRPGREKSVPQPRHNLLTAAFFGCRSSATRNPAPTNKVI